jgi:hypothetical protein
MGEKYDGIRCCWNPSRKLLYPQKLKKKAKISHHLLFIKKQERNREKGETEEQKNRWE